MNNYMVKFTDCNGWQSVVSVKAMDKYDAVLKVKHDYYVWSIISVKQVYY